MFSGIGWEIGIMLIATAAFGSFCVAVVWVFVLIDGLRGPRLVVPTGFYLFSISVALPILDMIVSRHLPFETAQSPMFGYTVTIVLGGFTCILSFAFCLLSWFRVLSESGSAARMLRGSASLLLWVWGLFFATHLFGS